MLISGFSLMTKVLAETMDTLMKANKEPKSCEQNVGVLVELLAEVDVIARSVGVAM